MGSSGVGARASLVGMECQEEGGVGGGWAGGAWSLVISITNTIPVWQLPLGEHLLKVRGVCGKACEDPIVQVRKMRRRQDNGHVDVAPRRSDS